MQAAGSSGSHCDTASAPAGADVESSTQASTAAKTAKQSDGRLLGPPLINSVASPLRAPQLITALLVDSRRVGKWIAEDRTAWELGRRWTVGTTWCETLSGPSIAASSGRRFASSPSSS